MNNKIIWGQFDRLRPNQIEAIKKENPIAYLPWGAIEYHGCHNPTGLDSHKAFGMCVDLAKEVGGLVFPVVNLAANLISSYPGVDFPMHSIEFSEGLVKMICQEYLEQLAKQDFKIVVLLTGHAGEPHIDILRDTCKAFNEKYPEKHFWYLAEFDILPDELLVANHSAIGETSLQLHYAPETVDLDCLPKEGDISLEIHAVSGEDPRPASSKLGLQIIETFVKNASDYIRNIIAKMS